MDRAIRRRITAAVLVATLAPSASLPLAAADRGSSAPLASGLSPVQPEAAGTAGSTFCRFDLGGGRAPETSTLPSSARHCTCLEKIDYFVNGDQQYDQAVMWMGAALDAESGAFAEYYETPDDRPGAVCQLVLHVTDVSAGTRGVLDLIVWDDDGGLPGEVLGVLPAINILSVAPFPAIGTEVLEVYERIQIGVQGGFWIGIQGRWDPGDCSILLAVDTIDEDPGLPALRRGAATFVGSGAEEIGPGWHLLEELLGVPAATGINAVVGWCPVPVQRSSWGEIKRIYDR